MYTLSYAGGGNTGQLRMSFGAGAVTALSIVPKQNRDPREIPITKEQLVGALDPIAAAFFRARSDNPNGDLKVCDQTVPVFDGGWRFDLVLTPKRKVAMRKEASTAYSRYAAVCASGSSQSPDTHLTMPTSSSCPIRTPLRSGSSRCPGPICMCRTTFCYRRIPAYYQQPQRPYMSKGTDEQIRSPERFDWEAVGSGAGTYFGTRYARRSASVPLK